MIGKSRVLAIIPARGGSKGLPGKNIRPMCGKPLLGWTVEKALKSRCVDEVMVSTDSEEIAEVARQHGATVPILRPAELATDTASSYDVIRHAVAYQESVGHVFDYIVLLEPTSPLREDDDIDRMLERLDAHAEEFDSIVSVGEVSHHPSIMKRVDGARIQPFYSGLGQTTRRQDNEPAYFPFGVAYIAKTATLLEENTFYSRRCMPFVIKRYQNYEIDDLHDFLCVESIMKHEWRVK
jgi:CMP-N,N'-diacetyllegionaminic acid synthase